MTRDGEDHAWALAQQLERLLLNARGAIRTQDPKATDIEFRVALLTATAHVLVDLAPPSDDVERQAQFFARILVDHLRRERRRESQLNLTEQLLGAYQGPETA